jgi:hypothetical protein
MPTERRWVMTHDSPSFDLNGMPQVQCWEFNAATTEPIAEPLGSIENVRAIAAKQAALERANDLARGQADRLRSFRPAAGRPAAARPRDDIIDVVSDGVTQHVPDGRHGACRLHR